MPLIINSAPDCITHVEGAKPADDSADFILQANYQDCAGFMTFGPGSTYGWRPRAPRTCRRRRRRCCSGQRRKWFGTWPRTAGRGRC